jgi:hypothetical protein
MIDTAEGKLWLAVQAGPLVQTAIGEYDNGTAPGLESTQCIWLPVEGMRFRWASAVGRETLALLKILSRGNQDTQAGRVKPVADVVARLRAKRETASPYICPRP